MVWLSLPDGLSRFKEISLKHTGCCVKVDQLNLHMNELELSPGSVPKFKLSRFIGCQLETQHVVHAIKNIYSLLARFL